MSEEIWEVINNTAEKRFEVNLGDKYAIMEYMLHGQNMIFTHTEVPPEFEGRGIAGQMAKFALDYSRSQGYRVQPLCPYVKSYVQRHKEYHDISWGF